jgi:hypothetical protein
MRSSSTNEFRRDTSHENTRRSAMVVNEISVSAVQWFSSNRDRRGQPHAKAMIAVSETRGQVFIIRVLRYGQCAAIARNAMFVTCQQELKLM